MAVPSCSAWQRGPSGYVKSSMSTACCGAGGSMSGMAGSYEVCWESGMPGGESD